MNLTDVLIPRVKDMMTLAGALSLSVATRFMPQHDISRSTAAQAFRKSFTDSVLKGISANAANLFDRLYADMQGYLEQTAIPPELIDQFLENADQLRVSALGVDQEGAKMPFEPEQTDQLHQAYLDLSRYAVNFEQVDVPSDLYEQLLLALEPPGRVRDALIAANRHKTPRPSEREVERLAEQIKPLTKCTLGLLSRLDVFHAYLEQMGGNTK